MLAKVQSKIFTDLVETVKLFSPSVQVFDVVLNGDLTIASDLDIFDRVGRGVAHDEYIEFEVKDQKIMYEGDESELTMGQMRVEFIKVRVSQHSHNLQTFDKKRLRNVPELPGQP